MKGRVKRFLDALSIDQKSLLLITVIGLGTLAVGMLSHFGVGKMGDSYNGCFEQNLIPLQKLEKSRKYYIQGIDHKLQILENNKSVDLTALTTEIDKDKDRGFREWKSFLSSYYKDISTKDINLQTLIDKLQNSIVKYNSLISNSMIFLKNEGLDTFVKISYKDVKKSIIQLDGEIADVMEYELNKALQNRVTIKNEYGKTQKMIIFLTLLLFASALVLTKMLAKNFINTIDTHSKTISYLELRNQEILDSIESKVDDAVKQVREKDQIMYQNARLASMGEMIGNIAHQWRQPLNALTLLIQSFGIKNETGNLNKEFVQKQVDEGMRLANSMSDTIEDFRNFFLPSKNKELFSLKKAIGDTLEMSSFFCKDENISISLDGEEDIKIYGYANEFSQVILNFINNARENFRQREIDQDKKIFINITKAKLGKQPIAKIEFIDNGGGIDEHIIDRIFEPYFTTKHKSTGTGIGLYMSKQIIETQMNGTLNAKTITKEIDSHKYKCALFEIDIPLDS